jgi:hypothetical protein
MYGLSPADAGGEIVAGNARLSVTVVVTLLLLPLLSVISFETGIEIAPVASAQNPPSCKVGMAIDEWSVEEFTMNGDGWGDGYEPWMETNSGPTYDHEHCPLRSSFSTSFVLNNDSAVGLRMHLTTGWKYTFSVNLQHLNESDEKPIADVYLLQDNDFGRYEFDFDSRHNEWEGMRDDIAHSAPWLQNLILWHPFRDVHSYEKLHEVDFAVALDHEERSYSLWDDSAEIEEMFLLVESWDNIRDYDAKSQKVNYSVDVTILVEERFSLPNWTVSLVCCGGLMSILAAPFLVHTRYMKAGLDAVESGGADLMPHLDTAPERAPTVPNMPQPPEG